VPEPLLHFGYWCAFAEREDAAAAGPARSHSFSCLSSDSPPPEGVWVFVCFCSCLAFPPVLNHMAYGTSLR